MIIYKIEENVERNCIIFGHRLVVPTLLQEHFLNELHSTQQRYKKWKGEKSK